MLSLAQTNRRQSIVFKSPPVTVKTRRSSNCRTILYLNDISYLSGQIHASPLKATRIICLHTYTISRLYKSKFLSSRSTGVEEFTAQYFAYPRALSGYYIIVFAMFLHCVSKKSCPTIIEMSKVFPLE